MLHIAKAASTSWCVVLARVSLLSVWMGSYRQISLSALPLPARIPLKSTWRLTTRIVRGGVALNENVEDQRQSQEPDDPRLQLQMVWWFRSAVRGLNGGRRRVGVTKELPRMG